MQIRDVDGEFRENVTFHSHPIVLTRMSAAVFEIYSVLLSKGYIHVKMVGRKSTRDNVLKLLGELEGPMSSVLTRLNLRLDSSAPASQNERHDTTLALQASITAWSKMASAGDVDALDSRTAYSAWLEKVYTEDAAAGDTLVVSTIHGYKGRQATRVCIFQPDHLPLPDRLRLGGTCEHCEDRAPSGPRQDSVRTLSGLCQDSVRTLSGLSGQLWELHKPG